MTLNPFIKSLAMTAALIVAGSIMLQMPTATAQKQNNRNRKVIELKKQTPIARGNAKDPHIISDTQLNDPSAKVDPPQSKGGAVTRGGTCEVRLDNWTNLIIKIYIDGRYRGTVGPYNEAVGYAYAGETEVYARADYTNGTYSYWGPKSYSCNDGQYIYFKMID